MSFSWTKKTTSYLFAPSAGITNGKKSDSEKVQLARGRLLLFSGIGIIQGLQIIGKVLDFIIKGMENSIALFAGAKLFYFHQIVFKLP